MALDYYANLCQKPGSLVKVDSIADDLWCVGSLSFVVRGIIPYQSVPSRKEAGASSQEVTKSKRG